jgi:hypothetical protein
VSESTTYKLQTLVNEQVFIFAQSAQQHYKTSDLVVFLDLTESNTELQALPRSRLANSAQIPEKIRLKLSKPATEAREVLSSPNQSFWFFVIHENGEAECAAINASLMAPGGTA